MNAPDPNVNVAVPSASRVRLLGAANQSVWLDFITRDLLRSGDLARLIEGDGVTGVTSNPAIFQRAISTGNAYEASIDTYASKGAQALQVYEALAIADIRDTCDLFAPVYKRTHARDGYVSLEVNPHLARDPAATLIEARRLFGAVARPNLMIKIPGTAEALPAVTGAIAEGINVNVTLIFSVQRYEQVLEAWLGGLEAAARAGSRGLPRTASVASFFISRVDAAVDPLLQKLGAAAAELQGMAAMANATAAYAIFLSTRESPRFRALAELGAQMQRPLWASTSSKNASYRDVIYAEGLVAADTVSTLPPQTLAAFRDHGEVRSNLASPSVQAEARHLLNGLKQVGVDLNAISAQLEREGVKLFADAFDSLLQTISRKSNSHKSS